METVKMSDLSKEVTTMEIPNIYRRMLAVQKDLKTVAKNLNVPTSKTDSYKAVSEVDILNAVKPLEEKHGIYSYPISREIIDSAQITRKTQYGEKADFFLRIKTTYRFINVDDTSEYIDMTTYADGIDSGDKATGKAMTYADKYALMKAYKISTGDDPDQEASQEYKNEPKKAAPANNHIPAGMNKEDYNKTLSALTSEWKSLRSTMDSMNIDYRSKAVSDWLEKNFKIKSQDLVPDLQQLSNINNAYKATIQKYQQKHKGDKSG